MAANITTRLRRTTPFSRLLRHAVGYSETILTPNLQGFIYFYTNSAFLLSPLFLLLSFSPHAMQLKLN